MRMRTRLAVITATAALAGTLVAAPAHADPLPAVTDCAFTGLYADYSEGRLSGLKYYYPYNISVTVTGGNADAWYVTVDHNGQQGWMEGDCVRFLA